LNVVILFNLLLLGRSRAASFSSNTSVHGVVSQVGLYSHKS